MTFRKSLVGLFLSGRDDSGVKALYAAAVAQARTEQFYLDLAVPDTVEGRFDLLILHIYLLMRPLGGELQMKQSIFDFMFADMDQNLREMGVGDMGIGRRMKAMIGAFYGRSKAYDDALKDGTQALKNALLRNIYDNVPPTVGILDRMTFYVQKTAAQLDQTSISDIRSGHVMFSFPL